MKGEKKKAIQIGTVMTHPEYRRRASIFNGLFTKPIGAYRH
ncbi:hypothetical protein ACX12E_23935 [Paenibacillus vandeheii]